MGDSHYKSNIKGKDGTETISNFASITGTALVGSTSLTSAAVEGTTSLTSPKVIASSYLTVGTNRYLFFNKADTMASVNYDASALTATPRKGSITLGAGALWVHTADYAATKADLT